MTLDFGVSQRLPSRVIPVLSWYLTSLVTSLSTEWTQSSDPKSLPKRSITPFPQAGFAFVSEYSPYAQRPPCPGSFILEPQAYLRTLESPFLCAFTIAQEPGENKRSIVQNRQGNLGKRTEKSNNDGNPLTEGLVSRYNQDVGPAGMPVLFCLQPDNGGSIIQRRERVCCYE